MKYLAIFLFLILTKFTFAQQVQSIDTISIDEYKMESIYLPPVLNEISTLEYEKEDQSMASFWGLNDSDSKPEIYRFNAKTGEIINTIFISNAPNIDWEEISSDDHRIYFADFGNNLGKRKDLAIYFIEKMNIDYSKSYQQLKAEKIEFYYPEQETFQFKNMTTNWDAEAFFVYDNQLHFFTKEWSNLATTHYIIPIDTAKKHAAKKVETFKTNYAVTAAFIDADKNSPTKGIYLLGYTKEALAFISWFDLPEDNNQLFFTSQVKKISLPLGFTTQLGQLEGISVLPTENKVCFSGEEFKYKGFYAKQVVHCINNFTN
ncbi:hypothetical protein F0358_09620 [Empedobacter brevis]|uniref:hypothetical protein n=1 Tax=Empedobacter brevis TaxID=247 RepID=UPI00123E0808|nr:hypothetical protein [Empedobacter brevis]QES92953.1 hypothetical protein F0358_09620 [Empedobacter brevis]